MTYKQLSTFIPMEIDGGLKAKEILSGFAYLTLLFLLGIAITQL